MPPIPVEHGEVDPLVEDVSVGSFDRSASRRPVFAISAGVSVLVGLAFVASPIRWGAVQPPASMGFVGLEGKDTDKEEEKKKKKITTIPSTTDAVIPGGTTFLLDSVVGPITSSFISNTKYVGKQGLTAEVLRKQSDVELQQRDLIGGSSSKEVPKSCTFCRSDAKLGENNACCYEVLSGKTQVNPDTEQLQDIPNLKLKVAIGYERLLDASMVKYVRGMGGVVAKERASLADELRNKGVYDQKQLKALQGDKGELLRNAGVPEEAISANEQSLSALSTMPDVVSAEAAAEKEANDQATQEAEDQINGRMDEAKGEETQRAAEAQAMYDNAKKESEAAMLATKAQAQSDLDKTTAKLAELELGSADLKGNEAELTAMVDQRLAGAAELTKGYKVNTWQLIQRNGILGGRFFHAGVSEDEEKIRLNVVEFTADALAELPNPSTGTEWIGPNVAGADSQNLRQATVVSQGYGKDYLASMVTRQAPASSTEYTFSTSSSRDSRTASRMYSTYGASASGYVQKQASGGLSFGIPGVMKVGGGYSQTSSKSSASSQAGESDASSKYSQTGTSYYQVSFYEEPRLVVLVPRYMLQATSNFLNISKYLYARTTLEDATKRLFTTYGTHVCPKVTLGGRWRISAHAYSLEATKYESLAEATSQAISEASATGRSAGASAAGSSASGASGAASASGGSGKSEQSEESSAGGDAEKGSEETRDVSVTTQQDWQGGQSGGTAAAWRASLSENENSNWKVLSTSFQDCMPVWAFFPDDLSREKIAACMYWYGLEIKSNAAFDEQAQEELMSEVPRKCIEDPDTTYMGPLAEAFKKAVVREKERQAEVQVKADEWNLIVGDFQARHSCDETVKLSNMLSEAGDNPAGDCATKQNNRTCAKLCSDRDGCRGYWLEDNGKCCPKKNWEYEFTKDMDGGEKGGFYQCKTAKTGAQAVDLTAKARVHWGKWASSFSKCSRGLPVIGMRQRCQEQGKWDDDTALNAVELMCRDGTKISSSMAQMGQWGEWKKCEAGHHLVGYRLRSMGDQGGGDGGGDDSAAIGIAGICSDGQSIRPDLSPPRGWFSNGRDTWGTPWREARCPPGFYITGLKTFVEPLTTSRRRKNTIDNTALNDVKMQCVKQPEEKSNEDSFIGDTEDNCRTNTAIDTEADCLQAGSMLSLVYQRSEISPWFPSGCYTWGPTISEQYSVYFNSAPEGAGDRDRYAFTSICYRTPQPFVFKFNGCPRLAAGLPARTTLQASSGSSLTKCANACTVGCTGFVINGCTRGRRCSGACSIFFEHPDEIVNGECDTTGNEQTFVLSTTATTTQSNLYRMVGQGVMTPQKWNVGEATGKGVEACYNAAMEDSDCKGGYFMYSVRAGLNCGCTKAGKQKFEDDELGKLSDYYSILSTTSTSQTCNPNTCDGLICKAGTKIEVADAGGHRDTNYGSKRDTLKNVGKLTEAQCKNQVGSTRDGDTIMYTALGKSGDCLTYLDYFADTQVRHVDLPIQKAWVLQRNGLCCAKGKWDCCGTGSEKFLNREYCPRTSMMCGSRKCSTSGCSGETKDATWYCAIRHTGGDIVLEKTYSLSNAQAALNAGSAGNQQAIIPMSGGQVIAGGVTSLGGDPHTLSKTWTGGSMWWGGWPEINSMRLKCASESPPQAQANGANAIHPDQACS